jgi:hypothetical protein
MKNKLFTILPNKLVRDFCLACLLLLGTLTGANAGITVGVASPNTTYVVGSNTFTFNVSLSYTGAEYVDRYHFGFPAGIVINSGTPASGGGACGNDDGIQAICSPNISWSKVGVPCTGAFAPTGCGVYNDALGTFSVTFTVPPGFTGPLTMTLTSVGDGFLLPAGTVDVDVLTFTQEEIVAPGDPCEIVCPDDIVYNLDPGACEQIINWNPPTTIGDCAVPVLEPGTISQNNSETAVDDALSCFAGDRHFRAYDLVAEGIAGDFQMELRYRTDICIQLYRHIRWWYITTGTDDPFGTICSDCSCR